MSVSAGRKAFGVGLGLLLVAAAWEWRCASEVHAVRGVSELYGGTLQAPIVGLQLAGDPTILVRELMGHGQLQPSLSVLALVENATFSADWKQVFHTRLTDRETIVDLPSGVEATLAGENRLALDSAGNTWVATAEIPPLSDQFEVRIRGPQGEPLADLVVPGLEWVEVAATGKRVALGSSDGVEILERSGASIVRRPGRAEFGALSDDGEWLALERLGGPSPRLESIPVQAGGASESRSFDVPEGDGVVFAPGGRVCVHVAREEVHVFRLEGAGFVPARQHAAPPGFVWRDAAFDRSGRLALSRIQIERPPMSDGTDATHPYRGSARVAIDFLGPDGRASTGSREWDVELWNAAAPDLAFDERGRCYALVWPSAYEVEPTWLR